MRAKLSDHIRRNAYGLIAVFIALGGTGYAATHLDRNAVKSKQIKNGEVKTIDLADDAVTNAKLGTNEAFARIDSDGALSGGHGITPEQVTHPATGVYCIDATFASSAIFVTGSTGSTGVRFTALPSTGSCPFPDSAVEATDASNNPVNASFYILLK